MIRAIAAAGLAFAGLIGGPTALAQSADRTRADPTRANPTSFASSGEIAAEIGRMERDMKPDQGFLWRPLVQAGGSAAALEYWRKPGRPAVHPAETEYAIVVAGEGSLVSGGHLADASVTRPGLTEGRAIEHGTTRALRKGDVVMIPAGVPHWFGVRGGKLVLLGIKLASPAAASAAAASPAP